MMVAIADALPFFVVSVAICTLGKSDTYHSNSILNKRTHHHHHHLEIIFKEPAAKNWLDKLHKYDACIMHGGRLTPGEPQVDPKSDSKFKFKEAIAIMRPLQRAVLSLSGHRVDMPSSESDAR